MAIVIQTLSDSAQARKDLGELKSSVQSIQKSSEGLADKFASIGKSLAFGATAVGAAVAFTRLSDSMTNLNNRIKSVTDSAGEARNALFAISQIAVGTRTNLDATARLYTKLTGASKDLGASQAQIVAVTKTINQGFKISGASAEESRAAITQLSQAFASGKLAGDEFNSVMENAPFLAKQITTGMGISLRELYKLRDEGKLFARDVFAAILKQGKDVENRFKRISVTYADAFTNLGTSLKLLFNSVWSSIAGSGGGLADVLNGWAENIASFAQNFQYYLLRAKTTAIVFIIDVTEFFKGLWEAITEKGPDAIFQMFKDMANWAYDWLKSMIPYGKQLYNTIVSYASSVYAASSILFFNFLAWLNKSERTQRLSGWLYKTNAMILEQANRLRDAIDKINFTKIYDNAVEGLKRVWKAVSSYDYIGLMKRVRDGVKSAFDHLVAIDVNKFFPNLNKALDVVKKWARDAAHWFWWLYDVVIGHSYIPDLVEGVQKWMSKLMGGPMGAAKKFALGVATLFARLNPFKLLGLQVGGFTKIALGAAAAIGAAYGFRDKLGLTDFFSNAAQGFTNAFERLIGYFDGSVDKMKEGATVMVKAPVSAFDKFKSVVTGGVNKWLAPGTQIRQDQLTGEVTESTFTRNRLMDQLRIPRESQAEIATGIAAAVTAGLYLAMGSGTTRDVVIGLFTTAAGIFMARAIEPKVLEDFFSRLAAKFLGWISKGMEMLLGTTVSNDPFGFLALIAKLSLLFAAGRAYFLSLITGILTAPTKMGKSAGGAVALASMGMQLKKAENQLAAALEQGAARLRTASVSYENALNSLATTTYQGNRVMAEAQVKANLTNPNITDPRLKAAVDAENQRRAAAAYKTDPEITQLQQKAREAKKPLETAKEKFREGAAKAKEGITSFGTGAAGIVGAGVGLQYGSEKVAEMTEKRRADAIEKLMNAKLRIEGKDITREQAEGIAKGEIDIKDLDESGRKIAEAIVKNIDVPAFQSIGVQMGASMGGQLLLAAAAGVAMQIAGTLTKIAAEKTWELIKAAWEKVRLVTRRLWELGTAAAAALVYNTALRIGMIASAAKAGATFLLSMVSLPVLIGAAVVAAVLGAAYLIYKYKDEIWRAMKAVANFIYKAFMDPVNTWKNTLKFFETAIDSIFKKVRSWLPKWMGGTAADKPAPSIEKTIEASRSTRGPKYAEGGWIYGAGTATSDSIPAMLSNGEFVVNAKSASRHRALLEALNSNKRLPRFAKGGSVGGNEIVVTGKPILDSGIIGDKIAEAIEARAEAMNAANKASIGWQRNAAERVVQQWTQFINDARSLQTFADSVADPTTEGGTFEEEEDKKKKRKEREQKAESDTKSGLTFGEELDAINSIFPDLSLEMNEYLKMTGEARKALFDLAIPLYNTRKLLEELPSGSGEVFQRMGELADRIDRSAASAAAIANPGRNSFAGMQAAIGRTGVNISQEDFNTFTPEAVTTLQGFLATNEALVNTIKTNPLDQVAIRNATIKMRDNKKAMEEWLTAQANLLLNNPFDIITVAAEKAGVSVDRDAFNHMTNATRKTLSDTLKMIADLQNIANNAADDAERIAAQREIDRLRETAGKLIKGPEDRAKQAGEDFASTMRDAFSKGLFDFVKTGKLGSLIGIFQTFTDKLIGNFIDTIANSFLGKGTKGGSLFEKIGAASVGKPDIGGALGGILGGKKGAQKAGDTVAGTILNSAPDVGAKVVTPLVEGAGDIGKVIGEAQADTVAKAASAGGGGGGMAGLAGLAGSLVGLLIGSLFAEGGYVSGPGTSTSDSIPARLSNGEYVIKARQVRKHHSLIAAINDDKIPKFADGGLVGQLSDTAAIKSVSSSQTSSKSSSNTTNLQIVGDISRQTKREVLQLLPQIAAGVNQINKEKGIR